MIGRLAIDGGAGGGRCIRCAADVASLPAEARYCNRCGAGLPNRCGSAPLPECDPFPRSLILLAYARALFNLGCRYETAVGSRRNPEEAARCFAKAARLGDLAIMDRSPGESWPLPPSPPLARVYHPSAF